MSLGMFRSRYPNLSDKMLRALHEVLLSVENDEGQSQGFCWSEIRNLRNEGVIVESNTKKSLITIPDNPVNESIYFRCSNSKGKCFIKSLRDAFAHNYIVEGSDGYVNIKLPLRGKGAKGIKLACRLSNKRFIELVSMIIK